MRRYVLRQPRKNAEVWQIIYMDLMTMVMVFFVILWSLNQGTDTGVTDAVGEETARMVSLPADILFAAGKSKMTADGQGVFQELFEDETGKVLNFDTGGLTRRLLVVHGHTDSDGEKDENFDLGFRRAFNAYHEMVKYGLHVPEHTILCSHADNSPAQATPRFHGEMTAAQRSALREAKARNRRIEIEDRMVTVERE
jgi:outer membrane protein OmpA-like peptidoglycan-associated protein